MFHTGICVSFNWIVNTSKKSVEYSLCVPMLDCGNDVR